MKEGILAQLRAVEVERALRHRDAALGARVTALKAFQQQRFAHTYADLLASARYGAAARFFLDELYGPGDFSLRDQQFSRVVPALVRLFPEPVVQTVATLAELHATTERLDTAMARHAEGPEWTPARYVLAWQAVGHAAERAAQIDLAVAVATRLDVLTRKPLLRHSLRLMRKPAQAAGLAALQQFLESGFDTFGAMGGAAEFIRQIETRERALVAFLFTPEAAVDPGRLMNRPAE